MSDKRAEELLEKLHDFVRDNFDAWDDREDRQEEFASMARLLLAQYTQEVKAEALEEAADTLGTTDSVNRAWAKWLRARASQLRRDGE